MVVVGCVRDAPVLAQPREHHIHSGNGVAGESNISGLVSQLPFYVPQFTLCPRRRDKEISRIGLRNPFPLDLPPLLIFIRN